MTQHKATFKSSYTDKYDSRYTELTYEYRGHEYTVIKANNWSACSSEYTIGDKTLAKQHKRAQAEIDEMIDNPVIIPGPKKCIYEGSAQEGIDLFFKFIEES